MKKFKIKGTLTVVGTISFPDEEGVLKDYRETIKPGCSLETIAEDVLANYTMGSTDFVEGVGKEDRDFYIEDYDTDWDLEEVR